MRGGVHGKSRMAGVTYNGILIPGRSKASREGMTLYDCIRVSALGVRFLPLPSLRNRGDGKCRGAMGKAQ